MDDNRHMFVTVQDAIDAGIEYRLAELEQKYEEIYDNIINFIVNKKDQIIKEQNELLKEKEEFHLQIVNGFLNDRNRILRKLLSHFTREELMVDFKFSLDEIQEALNAEIERFEKIKCLHQQDIK